MGQPLWAQTRAQAHSRAPQPPPPTKKPPDQGHGGFCNHAKKKGRAEALPFSRGYLVRLSRRSRRSHHHRGSRQRRYQRQKRASSRSLHQWQLPSRNFERLLREDSKLGSAAACRHSFSDYPLRLAATSARGPSWADSARRGDSELMLAARFNPSPPNDALLAPAERTLPSIGMTCRAMRRFVVESVAMCATIASCVISRHGLRHI